jgi:carbonic anhydrase
MPPARAAETEQPALTPQQALDQLKAGNARYRKSALVHPHQTAEHRLKISEAQHPFAQVLACSDSRVSPEIVFDEGLGDLFVVRVAGNIVDDAVKGTLEYGAEHLHVPLIVVMGHTGCGAVTAAVEAAETHDHIVSLMDAIFPAVLSTRGQPGDPVDNAVRANVLRTVQELRQSWPTLYRLHAGEEIAIVGAIYDLHTGQVLWLDD